MSHNAPNTLYGDTTNRIGKSRPRFTYLGDTPKVQTTYTRSQQTALARELFTSCPDLGGAILSKAEWAVGPGSFYPIHAGENSKWGDQAEDWLVNSFYPVASIHGPNYPFTKLLELSSIALDVDGDTGMFQTYTRDGLPRVGLLPSHRIGQRYGTEPIIKEGRYRGNRILDGVILSKAGFPLSARILGDKPEEDIDVPFGAFSLLYDAEWADQTRGISRIARSRYDWQDQDDINEFIKRNTKLATSIGIKYKSATGTSTGTGFPTGLAGVTEDTGSIRTGVEVTPIQGGEIYFLNSLNGEDIEVLQNNNPSGELEAFMARIQARALYSIGWPKELLDPSKIGGASVRLIQDLVRKTIAKRQMILERRARSIVLYAIATAMEIGELQRNEKDWWNWTFTKGSLLTVDGGNESKSDIENYKLGIDTLSGLISKQGKDWYQVRNQTQKEVDDLIDRAQDTAKRKNISFEMALTLLRQSTPNASPVATPPPADNSKSEDPNNNEKS